MVNIRSNFVRGLAVLGLSLVLGGCGHPGYNLNIALDHTYAKSLGDDKVFIHIVPVNPHDHAQLAAMSVDNYWQHGDGTHQKSSREDQTDIKIFSLSSDSQAIVLTQDDPIWSVWRDQGAAELLILTSAPAPERAGDGEVDSRRRFIPASADSWNSPDVHVAITEDGLRVQTGQKH